MTMRCRGTAAAVAAIALAIGALPARATVQLPGLRISPGAGVDVTLSAPFDRPSSFGCSALTVRIRNDADQPRAWQVDTESSAWGYGGQATRGSSWTLPVEARSERTFALLAPTAGSEGFSRTTVRMSGPGISGEADHGTGGFGPSNSGRTFAMSRTLAATSWSAIEDAWGARPGSRGDLPGARFAPTDLPADWRGWTPFAMAWLTDTDWAAIDPTVREGVLDWISRGGELVVATERQSAEAAAAVGVATDGDKAEYGLGRIRFMQWDGVTLDPERFLQVHGAAPRPRLASAYDDHRMWPRGNQVGQAELAAGLFMTFLTAFAVLVGPVNLFVFCRGRRRYRLFWTTPAISVGAGLLMALLVLFQEGTGGRGVRTTLALMMPERNRALIVQGQVSRTGALLSTGFDTGEPAIVEPVRLERVGGARYPKRIRVSGARYTGDLFSSRSVQAHYIESIRPSRARVELLLPPADGAPSIVSSAPARLARLYVVDRNGRAWLATNVAPGEERRLEPVDYATYREWWTGMADQEGEELSSAMHSVAPRRGWFFASSEENEVAVPTLGSVAWEDDRLLVCGPVREIGP